MKCALAIVGLGLCVVSSANAALRAMTPEELMSVKGGDLRACDTYFGIDKCTDGTHCYSPNGYDSYKYRPRAYWSCSAGYGGCPTYNDPCTDGVNYWPNSYDCGVHGSTTHYVDHTWEVNRTQCYNHP
jgi:hypothetical protein